MICMHFGARRFPFACPLLALGSWLLALVSLGFRLLALRFTWLLAFVGFGIVV